MSLETIAGAGAAWLWDSYGKSIADRAIGAAKERWIKFNWQQAADKYRQRVKELYGTTRILGNPRPVSLAGIFTDAYLLDKPTALRRFDLEQLRAMAAERDTLQPPGQRRSALRLALEEQRLFILGKPGAGKTTFLRYVTLQAANGQINKIPIFVSLKEWADSGLELMPFLVKQFEICAFPEAQAFIEHILEAGQAIVLFDGLDEVKVEGKEHDRIITDVVEFSQKYWDSSCLITCRNAATDYRIEHFRDVEVADFDDNQIRTFVHKWFQENRAKAKKFLEEFAKEEHKGLRELAQTPLLLTLLCWVFDERMHFPQKRVDLYEEAIDLLLKQWDRSRKIERDDIYRKLSPKRKHQMLARIAAESFERNEYFFPQDKLAKRITRYLQKLPPADFDEDIDGEAVLKAIEAQHGLLVERAHKIYSFSPLTFQEYFTARYIAEDASKGTLARVIEQHLSDDRWREVFLLIASLLPNADTFFNLMRETIDDLIRGDERFVELLRWANRNTARDYELLRAEGREANLALIHAFTRSVALTYALACNFSFGFVHTHAYALSVDLYHANTYTLTHVSAGVLARTYSRVLDLFEALDFSRTSALICALDIIHNLAAELDSSELVQPLQGLAIPRADATLTEIQTFTDNLQTIITEGQWGRIEQYQRANELLLDCLKLAHVSDRARIENSLWLPPGEKREA